MALPILSSEDDAQSIGTDRVYQFQLNQPNTLPLTPYSVFLSTDTIAASIWAGDDQPALVSPACAWVDAATAKLSCTISAANTLVLANPGKYRLRIVITAGTTKVLAFDGWLRLSAAPGTATAIPTYGLAADLYDYAGWLDDELGDKDETSFLKQRGRARSWLDEIVIERGSKIGIYTINAGQPGFMAYSMAYLQDPWPSNYLRTQLAANALIVRDITKEIVAKRAISYVCDALVGGINKTSYQELGARFRWDSHQLVKVYRAELDFNADGLADMVVNCGYTNVR